MKQLLLNRKTVSTATSAATAAAFLSTGSAYAQTGGIEGGIEATSGADQGTNDLTTIIENVINILLFIVGVGAVIMLIIGGIRYVVSAGDQQAVANAKNTILYAIVGIVVAVLAYAAVNFVFQTLTQ